MSNLPVKYELGPPVDRAFDSFFQLDNNVPPDDLAELRQLRQGRGIHVETIGDQWRLFMSTVRAELANRSLHQASPVTSFEGPSFTMRRTNLHYHHGSVGGVGVLALKGSTYDGKLIAADHLFGALNPAKPDTVTHGFTRLSSSTHAGVYELSALQLPAVEDVDAVQGAIDALATDNWTQIALALNRRLYAKQPNGANLQLTGFGPATTDQWPQHAAVQTPPAE